MRMSISHPWWTHVPAIAVLLVLVAAVASAAPLPANAPVHFGPNGQPDSYGSPAAVFALVVGLSVGFIVLSVWLDELWSRQERSKTFNYFALLDEVVVGAMAGTGLGYLRLLMESADTYTAPIQEMLWFLAPATAGALVLERLRPYSGTERMMQTEDTTEFRRRLVDTIRRGTPLVYSDIQNPAYVNLLAVVLPAVILLTVTLAAATAPLWSTVLQVVVALLLITMYGGLRTSVTRQQLTIHLGTPGYRVLRLSIEEVTDVSLYNYMPLKEFGGYGVRRNRGMMAYYLSGGTGVLLTTRGGKKHLIGSDHPERLADVVRAVAGLATTH